MEFELIKKQLDEAKTIIASELPSLKEEIRSLEQEKANLNLELNRALMGATTYKNNWRRSFQKVQSLRLLNLNWSGKGWWSNSAINIWKWINNRAEIESYLSNVCSCNRFAVHLSQAIINKNLPEVLQSDKEKPILWWEIKAQERLVLQPTGAKQTTNYWNNMVGLFAIWTYL